MKKAFLSLSLFFAFTAYILYVHIVGTNVPIVLMPEPNKTKTTLSLPKDNNLVASTGKYKNGNYSGKIVDAYYGNVQVKAAISGGKITDVQFLDYPHDRQTSVRINSRAMPYLISEAITLQNSNVDTVSGASFTSTAFRESLSYALAGARI